MYATFAQPEIGRLEELQITGIEHRIEAELALGQSAARGRVQRLVEEHPSARGSEPS